MTKIKYLLITILGLSFWFIGNSNSQKSRPESRGPANEDFEMRETFDEEDTDYYESYQFQRDSSHPAKAEEGRPSPSEPSKVKKKKTKKSKDPIGDDVEWSKNSNDLRRDRCRAGDALTCYELGKSLMATDAREGTKFIAQACNLRDFTACEETGKILKQWQGADAAIGYFKAACDNASYADGCYETASYLESRGLASVDKISDYYRIACLEGNSQSCERFAN